MFDMLFLYIKDLSYSSSCSQVAVRYFPSVVCTTSTPCNSKPSLCHAHKMLILKLLFSLLGLHSPVIHVISRL